MDDTGQVIERRGALRGGSPSTSHMSVWTLFRRLAVILAAHSEPMLNGPHYTPHNTTLLRQSVK